MTYEIIDLPKITDPRGNLTVAEQLKNIPFEIKRVYWTYDVPGGESRGGHAHRNLFQLVVAISGSFTVTLDDGRERATVLLNHPWQGLLIKPGTWRTLDDFSTGAVCMVLASELYDEDDYIYDYDEFLKTTFTSTIHVEENVNTSSTDITIEQVDFSVSPNGKKKEVSTTCASEWDDFISHSKNGTFMHKRNYMDYHSDRFNDCSLMLRKKGRLWAVMPGNVDGTTFYTHQGLTYGGLIMNERCTAVDVLTAFNTINAWLKEKGVKCVVYKPIPYIYTTLPSDEDLYALFRQGARLTARGLSTCIDMTQRVKWRQTRRTALNAAEENGVTVEQTDDVSALAEFWTILEENLLTTHGVRPVHTLQEMQLLKSRFPNNIIFYRAVNKTHKTIGGMLLYVTSQVTHSQYITASPEGKQCGAIDAIMYTVLSNCTTRYFDFGVSTEHGGTLLNNGLIFQKEGFGGRGICYDTYEYTIS